MDRNAFLFRLANNKLLYSKALNNLICFVIIVCLMLPLSCNAFCDKCSEQDCVYQVSDYSYIIHSHDIKIDILSADNILVNETLIVQNNSSLSKSDIELWFNQSFSNLLIEGITGSLIYDFINDTSLLSINFGHDILTNQTKTLKFSYKLEREMPLIANDPSYYSFQFMTIVTYFTQNQKITVRLPRNSFIYEEEGIESYFPATTTPIDTGHRLALIWTFTDLSPCDNQFLFVLFDEPIGGGSPIWLYIIGPILGISLGIGLTVWIMKKREKLAMKKIGDLFLSGIQKEFLRIIAKNGGKITQRELTEITKFTKTKVSRNLISLEQQEMITREKWGRNYKISLTETGERVIK